MKKRPLRFARTILIFLLLGAILNVAMAWGCYFWPFFLHTGWIDSNMPGSPRVELARPIPQTVRSIYNHYQSKIPAGFRSDKLWEGSTGVFAFGNGSYHLYSSEWLTENQSFMDSCFFIDADCIGWPMYSLSACTIECWRKWQDDVQELYDVQIGYFLAWDSVLFLYRPIWPGFIFNTLFYAIPLWLLFPGRYMLRRRRRIRRGRCGQCGYIVAPNIGVPGASPNCPECGTPIAPGTPTPGTGKR